MGFIIDETNKRKIPSHLQGIHANLGVVHLELAEARIDHVPDTINGQ